MILSTTPQIEGHTIREYKGIVTGETIIGANMFKDLFAGIRDIVGGRAGSYEKVLAEAKDTSMQEMMQRAQALGANAIVGIDIDYETVGAWRHLDMAHPHPLRPHFLHHDYRHPLRKDALPAGKAG